MNDLDAEREEFIAELRLDDDKYMYVIQALSRALEEDEGEDDSDNPFRLNARRFAIRWGGGEE